jgi:hypothetical protein
MSEEPEEPDDLEEMSEEEAQAARAHWQRVADEWRERLEHPALRAMIQSGQAVVNPLVEELLRAFPPRPEEPPTSKP